MERTQGKEIEANFSIEKFFAGILVSVTASDFLHRAYARLKQE
jgi:hypothetical protein